MTRQTKTPRQRAEEAVGVEQRRVKKLKTQWTKAHDDAERLEAELATAETRLQYLRQHPDLKPNPGTTTPTTTTGDTRA